MAIINEKAFYYVETYDDRNSTPPQPRIKYDSWPGVAVRNWDDRDYWYVEFVNGDAFYHYPIDVLAGPEIFSKIKSGEIMLCISHVHEAYHYVINDIYTDVVIKLGIDPRNILFLTNSADIKNEIDIVSQKYNLPKIRSEFISLFEVVAKKEIRINLQKFAQKTLDKPAYEKKFISLNGLWRPHRLELMCFLESLNLIDKGYVSFNACPTREIPSMDEMFDDLVMWNKQSEESLKLLYDNEAKIKKLSRILLDTESDMNWQGAVFTSADKKYYENTYFSIVTETLCRPEHSAQGHTLGRAISEKTFKPILHHHPFMILGVKGALSLLKELGYRTFSPYIDESYDNEDDTSKRAYMIAQEAKRLVSLEGSELNDFLAASREIVVYNFMQLISKDVFAYQIT